jgi:phosphoenolpyruvate carboxykinase (ATP)
MDEPINTVFWLMKDHSLPPVIKLENPVLASVMGACLATKRTSAEKLAEGVDPDELVFENYANPFRTYPLVEDYKKFKYLFSNRGVACYVVNTGHFLDKKIPKEVTIEIIEKIVDGTGELKDFGPLPGIKTIDIEGFVPNFSDAAYKELVRKQFQGRVDYVKSRDEFKAGRDALPKEAIDELIAITSKI